MRAQIVARVAAISRHDRRAPARPAGEDRDRLIRRVKALSRVSLGRTLIGGHHPSSSAVGIALSISSIVVMPLLGGAKQRIGRRLGSGATAGEGAQNMLCAYMAAGVLAGLLANTLVGAWWLDPAIALAIAALAVREGREAWTGEGCACVAAPDLDGLGERCSEDCCAQSPLD